MKAWPVAAIRACGAVVALTSALAAPYAIQKIYTGRGGGTWQAALVEQSLLAFFGLLGLVAGLTMLVCARGIWSRRAWLNPRWVWRHRRAEAALLFVVLLLCAGLLEFASRTLYAIQYRFPITYAVEDLVYPPLREQFADARDNDGPRIAFLGGSVLYYTGLNHGDAIAAALGPSARVINLAQNGHASRDSLTKLRHCLERGERFDYVVFYHGINETRANNVPPDLFDPDYNHYVWYRLVNTVFNGRKPILSTCLRSTLVYRGYTLTGDLLATNLFGQRLLHHAYPRADWLQHGAHINSAESFARNLAEIAALCDARGMRLIIPEFVYAPELDDWAAGIPQRFSQQDIIHLTEQWGLPENVLAGMRAHNTAIRDLHNRARIVDTAALRRSDYFLDVCHFTEAGQQAFVQLLANALHAESSAG